MKEENLIHIKLEQGEAIQRKKDILSSEIGLLKTISSIRRYQLLRSQELNLKLILYKKIKIVLTNIRKLKKTLPQMKIPAILKRSEGKKEALITTPIIKRREIAPNDIEAQLKEIQDKLKELG